jgi:antitoxin component YwqK of YwqJK toxin-antitoxin module
MKLIQKLTYYLVYLLIALFMGVSIHQEVCAQKQKISKSEHSYSWINEQKVFVCYETGDTITLSNRLAIKNIKRLNYESSYNDSLPHYLLGEIDLYVVYCVLPKQLDVPLIIKEFHYYNNEGCSYIPKEVNLNAFLNNIAAIKRVQKIKIESGYYQLFSIPFTIKNNDNLVSYIDYSVTFLPLEMIFNSNVKLTEIFLNNRISYPERQLLIYLNNEIYKSTQGKTINYFGFDNFNTYLTSKEQKKIKILPNNGQYICHYKDGTPLLSGQFKNGKLDGEWVLYFVDSTIAQKRYYHEGKEIGQWIFYGEDGKINTKIDYENGEIKSLINKSYSHHYQKDTTVFWQENEKACELIREHSSTLDSNQHYIQSEIKIQFLDCNQTLIDERKDSRTFEFGKLKNVIQTFYINGILVKKIELNYDYALNKCTETVTKGDIITTKVNEINYKPERLTSLVLKTIKKE